MNKRYVTQLVIGLSVTAIAAGALAPSITEKLNENEKSKFNRIRNIIGVLATCGVAGYLMGTIIDVNENQIRFVEMIEMVAKKEG